MAVSNNGNMIFYWGQDNHIWYYFSDHDKDKPENWYRTPVNYSETGNGLMAIEPWNYGRLYYVGDNQKLHRVDWTKADNPLTCPHLRVNGKDITLGNTAAYKTDNSDTISNSSNFPVRSIDSIGHIAISVFPNPSKNTFTFYISGVVAETNMALKIEDLSGRTIQDIQKQIQPGKREELVWNANNESGGVYFYQLKLSNGDIFTGRLVKL